MKVRKARISDVPTMMKIIGTFAEKGDLLPRSLAELYEHIRDYSVCVDDEEVVGVCALHVMWEDLAEVRSLAVREGYGGKGAGSLLMEWCVEEAKKLGISKLFALTYRPEFFERFHFEKADKSSLPQKIWTDCLKCVKFPDCDETAVICELLS